MADRRIVAIVGKSPLTREMANEEPPGVEIWGLVDDYLFLKRWDRWFEMHQKGENGLYSGLSAWAPEAQKRHLDFLWDCGVPVYMFERDESVPTSVPYPFHEVGSRYRPYWTSSVAYMLSLAAYEKVDEVHLWGIEFASTTEYEQQRPCAEYWLGVLENQSCTIQLPHCSPMLRPAYGTYGSTAKGLIDAATIKDEIANVDALTENGVVPKARKALIRLLHRADPTTIGKPVISNLIRGIEIGQTQAGRFAP